MCKLERDFLNVSTWQRQKRSNSERRPQFLNLTTSKTKQFCETSSIFEVDNIKNEANLRGLLQKWNVECRADGLVPMRFAIFPLHLCKVLRLPRKSGAKSYVIRSAAPVTQNHLGKPTDLILQNATPLRKSAPWPPNDEHVSCTAPATRNASFQILFKCPTTVIFFETATKPSRFAHFWTGAQSLAPATQNDIWTSKSSANMWCFCTFWLRHVLCATTAYTFCKSQLPKVLQGCVFCTFWLRHVLGATTACTFSTSQLLKVLRTCRVFSFVTCKCASRHNGVQLFISHLTTWLRTRCFSEPTFRPPGAANHWKNRMFRDFPTFSRTWIFFLPETFSFLISFFFSSLLWLFPSLLFICPYCRKFDF